ncbi:LamG-like jellyroll fold domain-containing protein [Psychroserpens sp. SPM9]|uniref:LamG-like jellyroll fold domain-containing protein n=1 Tax=Psychroserpens sp. SPM9 TaxID=2975598 RepID=UPI0021A4A875|nr:LamG-like jellyroll fold domain-containing protein [Psychroserpens sp. SPM9]MDG5492172.1 T9SS type A sorting domain-containing protein [Psychroserpens sp. SPM9]
MKTINNFGRPEVTKLIVLIFFLVFNTIAVFAQDTSQPAPSTAVVVVPVSPGSVGNQLQLWMKADASTSTTTNNQRVNSWGDNSGNSFNVVKGSSNGPTYLTNAINFNPALRFTRSGGEYMKIATASIAGSGLDITPSPDPGITNPSSMSIFAAFLTDQSGAGTILSRATNSSRSYQLWLGDRDRVVHYTLARTAGTGQGDPNSGINYGITHARNDPKISSLVVDINGASLANDPNEATGKIKKYVNGYLDPLTTYTDGDAGFGTGETTNMDVLIGGRRNSNNTDVGNLLQGRVAEIIVYDRALTAMERQKVETYMAIKYGITLGYNDEYYRWENSPNHTTTFGYSGTSNDYVLSNNTYAWTGSDNAGFGYNVFGIARDDDSGLLQLKSKSVHVAQITKETSVLTMEDESGSISNDRDYLLVGNNGVQISLQSANVPERVASTIGRIWKARESSNDVGTIRLDFDLSQWSISGSSDLELIISKNSNLTNYKNIVGSYNSSTKTMTFTGLNLEDGDYFTLANLEELNSSYHFNFDGSSTYVDLENNFDLNPSGFTISAWIKRDANALGRSIIGKRNNGNSQGFDFKLNNAGRLLMTWRNALGLYESIQSSTIIPENEWHQVAAIYDGSRLTLYIDGVAAKSELKSPPASSNNPLLIGASGDTPGRYFSGDIDEVRLFNTKLSEDQLRFIMNQEIENSSNKVSGAYFNLKGITPTKNDIVSIPWSGLQLYLPFSHVRGNCLFNKSSQTSINGRMYNTPNSRIDIQTAPLPYVSTQNGNWDTKSSWKNGSIQPIPGAKSIVNSTQSVDWNIVETSHNLTMDNSSLDSENRSLLALLVNSNKITVTGDNSTKTGYGLTITHYLQLNGDIDLQGESQLIQLEDSDLAVTSSGTLEKDQQGTRDLYTYNYWSSPVGNASVTVNNTSYSLSSMFKDGTNPSSPQNINFITNNYNGTSGSPIGIADYWIWKFANQPDGDYSAWQHVRSNGSINAGEGFTMKGVANTSGNVSLEQNYTIKGKPNNGSITLPINAGNDYLVGNPYASAIDAHAFIQDNAPTIDAPGNTTGTLYFWEHWGGGSHVLAEYQGGYATYNLAGAVPAVAYGTADPDVDQSSLIGTKLPGRYIPVGQGFFVVGENTGTIKFNNSQRVFKTEASGNSTFMRNSSSSQAIGDAEEEEVDTRMKIGLKFNSVNTYTRKILVTADDNATMGYDWGYDASLYDNQADDMYWLIAEGKYVIQGVNAFNIDTKLPLGVNMDSAGENKISLDKTENIPNAMEIYLHDMELDIFHNLKEGEYAFNAVSGVYLNRFEIVFSQNSTLSVESTQADEDALQIFFDSTNEAVVISNPKHLGIDRIEMFTILGQSVFMTDESITNSEYKIETKTLSAGAYIVKVETESGGFSNKIIVN